MRKQKPILVLALLLAFVGSICAAQQSIEAHWEGVMVREGAELPVSFDFKNEAAGLTASFNSPTWRVKGIPLRKVSYTTPRVHFELVGDATTIIFDGQLMGDTITGQFREGNASGTFSISALLPSHPPSSRRK